MTILQMDPSVTILEHIPAENVNLPVAGPPAETLPVSVRRPLARVVERLYGEYGCCLPLPQVVDVVNGCVHDIQATPIEALPELAERLARHRLAHTGHHDGT